MRSPETLSEAELVEESVVRGGRLLLALAIALGLCVGGVAFYFGVLLITSTPRHAFERAMDQAVWIWPLMMIIVLPIALYCVERLQARRHAIQTPTRCQSQRAQPFRDEH